MKCCLLECTLIVGMFVAAQSGRPPGFAVHYTYSEKHGIPPGNALTVMYQLEEGIEVTYKGIKMMRCYYRPC